MYFIDRSVVFIGLASSVKSPASKSQSKSRQSTASAKTKAKKPAVDSEDSDGDVDIKAGKTVKEESPYVNSLALAFDSPINKGLFLSGAISDGNDRDVSAASESDSDASVYVACL